MTSKLRLDYEGFSEAELAGQKSVGVYNYCRHPTTRPLMVAYRLDQSLVCHVDLTQDKMPGELVEALKDPHVEKWAFNAAFERLYTQHVLRINTPYKGWRCAQFLAHTQSFSGGLAQVGAAMGLNPDKLKNPIGDKLIKMFCKPQRITKNQQIRLRDRHTNPEEWELFCQYNIQDVIAEGEIVDKLIRFFVPQDEWELYELDQRINDRGLPVNRKFVAQADIMSTRRKTHLVQVLKGLTGLANPNSTKQLLPWVQERGYRFNDMQKNTVAKVLAERKEQKEGGYMVMLQLPAVRALKLRQQSNKASVKKYPAIINRVSPDGRLRHCFQIGGAARTLRWAGRGPQPHNLTRTPKFMEPEGGDASVLELVAGVIESGDYDALSMTCEEPMVALSGSVRSSFQASVEKNEQFVVCDLSAIESAMSAWLTNCKRLLQVFHDGRDPYKDFGTELYGLPYDLIDKIMRTICKPGMLGCAYQLGGGELKMDKRTGLWGYAENMGVNITRDEAHRQVKLFRETYHEIPATWKKLENAVASVLNSGHPQTINGLLTFALKGPYLTIKLPSERVMYYYKPRMVDRQFEGRNGETYTRRVFSYMGNVGASGRTWGRVYSSGGKIFENVVQATSRDVLKVGMMRSHEAGFNIVGSVHDEIITVQKKRDNFYTLERLRDCMKDPIPWAVGLPLGAAGYMARIYRKD